MPATLEALRYRHPEHVSDCSQWDLLDAVVAGGKRLTIEVKRKLLANPDGRPAKVMEERLKLAPYTNKVGPILLRFNSQLFSKGGTWTGSTDSFWTDQFFPYGAILKGDDDSRASFDSLLSDSMFQALSVGKAIAQVDTRIASGESLSSYDQAQAGELNPYAVLHPRSALWDWSADHQGFLFAKLHRFRVIRDRWDAPPVPEHDFTIYQREPDGTILASRHTIRKRLKEKEKPSQHPLNLDALKPEDVIITTLLEPTAIFSIKGRSEFPIVTLTLPDELCIASQLLDCQRSYFNQTAALEWGIFTTNYAMPVISGIEDEDDDPGRKTPFGDGYYLTLKTNQSISWLERGGSGFSTAINYRSELKRDIYDQLQQIAMSAADGSAIIGRSGESKKEDRRPEQILLDRYGMLVRNYAKQILDVAAIAHNEDVKWEVKGFENFLGEGLSADIADQQGMSQITVPSLAFKKAKAKYFVKKAAQEMSFDPKDTEQAIADVENAKLEDFGGGAAQPPAPPAQVSE